MAINNSAENINTKPTRATVTANPVTLRSRLGGFVAVYERFPICILSMYLEIASDRYMSFGCSVNDNEGIPIA